MYLTNKTDVLAIYNYQLPAPDGPYTMSAQSVDGPYDLGSYFRKETHCVEISVCILSDAMLIGLSLVNVEARPIMVSKVSLPRGWWNSHE